MIPATFDYHKATSVDEALKLLDLPLQRVGTPFVGNHLLRQIHQTLVLHDALEPGQAPFKLIELDQHRILLCRRHQCAAAEQQRGRQQNQSRRT